MFIAFGRGHTVFSSCMGKTMCSQFAPRHRVFQGSFSCFHSIKSNCGALAESNTFLAEVERHYAVKNCSSGSVRYFLWGRGGGGHWPKDPAGNFPGSQMMLPGVPVKRFRLYFHHVDGADGKPSHFLDKWFKKTLCCFLGLNCKKKKVAKSFFFKCLQTQEVHNSFIRWQIKDKQGRLLFV